jgi:RNA polymerase sigma-70 factor (ECF subfamily)
VSAAGEITEDTRPSTDVLFPLLYRQLRSLAGPRQDLDDIVQNAAERALRSLQQFRGDAALSTWTYGVAYRTLLDHDRWYRRYVRRIRLDNDGPLDHHRANANSEAELVELRRAQRLYRALDRLPASKRAVVVLHDLQGLDVCEIARIVDAKERTVRSRLRDARKKLGQWLADDPLFDRESP